MRRMIVGRLLICCVAALAVLILYLSHRDKSPEAPSTPPAALISPPSAASDAVPTDDAAALKAQFLAARKQLGDGGPVKSAPFQQMWQSLAAYVERRANDPSAPDKDLADIITDLAPDLTATTTALDPETTAIAVNDRNQIGSFVIAARHADGHLTVWSISALPDLPQPALKTLDCWVLRSSDRPCQVHSVALLPNASDGARRFYIDAGYYQEAGATTGDQLSIWRWDGATAVPLSLYNYATFSETRQQGAFLQDNIIRVGEKSSWHYMSDCGACDGRQMVHRFAVTTDDVVDQGAVSLTPDLDHIDVLLDRIAHGAPAGDIVAPELLDAVSRSWSAALRANRFILFLFEGMSHSDDDPDSYCLMPSDLPPIRFRFSGEGDQRQLIEAVPNGCTVVKNG